MRWFPLWLAALIPLSASAQSPKFSEQEVKEELRRVEKNCAFAFAAALPKVPGLEIVAVRSSPRFDAKQKDPFAAEVEADVKGIGRSETFRAYCIHDLQTGAEIINLSAKP